MGGNVMPRKYYLKDVVQTKKPHPCGSDQWEVIRVGMDFKIKCLGCGRIVMMPRVKFEKRVKKLISREVEETEK